MPNTDLKEITIARCALNTLVDNDECHHDESDSLRTRETEVEVQGKLLQYIYYVVVM